MLPLDLNEVVADALRLVDGESRRRGVEVETELSAVLPAVRGDKTQLQQVLLNLVLNGMEAMANSSAAKRRITVQTAGDPNEEAEVVVTDTGPGIHQTVYRDSSTHSSRLRSTAWGWDSRLLDRSSKRTTGAFGRKIMPMEGRPSASRCQTRGGSSDETLRMLL